MHLSERQRAKVLQLPVNDQGPTRDFAQPRTENADVTIWLPIGADIILEKPTHGSPLALNSPVGPIPQGID
jgi:hypothetical protein